MLWLAVPVLIEQLLNMSVGLADTWLAGNCFEGDEYVAAIGLMAYVLWLLPCMFSSISIGATAMVSRFVGADDFISANRVVHQAFALGVVAAIVGTAIIYLWGDAFVRAMQLEGAAAALAQTYLAILVPVIPAMMIELVGIACLRGAGDTLTGFITMGIVNAVNVVVSVALVIGDTRSWNLPGGVCMGPLPFPSFGWDGLAIGTAAGHALGAMIVVVVLLRGRSGLRLRFTHARPNFKLMRRLLTVGIPGGADIAAILFCHLWFVGIINSLGTVAAAAHGLGIRIESLGYLPGAAFAVAATTLTGQFLGAQDPNRAARSALMTLWVGSCIMTLAGAAFYVFAPELIGFFLGGGNQETAALAERLLRIVAFAMPALAVGMILTGALRGAGDTRWPLLVTLLVFVGFRIPAAYVLALDFVELPLVGTTIEGFGLGAVGAWYAMVTEVFLRAALVAARFWHGGWKRVTV